MNELHERRATSGALEPVTFFILAVWLLEGMCDKTGKYWGEGP